MVRCNVTSIRVFKYLNWDIKSSTHLVKLLEIFLFWKKWQQHGATKKVRQSTSARKEMKINTPQFPSYLIKIASYMIILNLSLKRSNLICRTIFLCNILHRTIRIALFIRTFQQLIETTSTTNNSWQGLLRSLFDVELMDLYGLKYVRSKKCPVENMSVLKMSV